MRLLDFLTQLLVLIKSLLSLTSKIICIYNIQCISRGGGHQLRLRSCSSGQNITCWLIKMTSSPCQNKKVSLVNILHTSAVF